jgi:hypothetical protein
VWGVLLLCVVVGVFPLVGGILMLIASGKIKRGEKGFVLALVGQILCLVVFSTLVPLIALWPLIVMVTDERARRAIM